MTRQRKKFSRKQKLDAVRQIEHGEKNGEECGRAAERPHGKDVHISLLRVDMSGCTSRLQSARRSLSGHAVV